MTLFLSIQQQYILDVLRKLGVVRKDQLHTLVRGKFQRPNFEVNAARMEAMLRQLRAGLGEFCTDGDFVYLARGQPDALRLEAIDVMLELSEGAPQDFNARLDSPRLLRFAIGGDKLRLFSVACLSDAADPTMIHQEKLERIVWISGSGTPPEQLALPSKHFFAARQQDGSHCFYGSNGP